MKPVEYPPVLDPGQVGKYEAHACAGGGYVWDAVLEYRVWCHPELGAPDHFEGDDYFCSFDTYSKALDFANQTQGAKQPIALILQVEHIDEPEPGVFEHVTQTRVTEWPVEFLTRPKRDKDTLPNFFAPDAPDNRLDIIRGLAK